MTFSSSASVSKPTKASSNVGTSSSKFEHISSRINKLREKKLDFEKKKEKSDQQRLKDIQKQQANLPKSPAQTMQENFAKFKDVSMNNSAAIPSAQPLSIPSTTNLSQNNQQKIAFEAYIRQNEQYL